MICTLNDFYARNPKSIVKNIEKNKICVAEDKSKFARVKVVSFFGNEVNTKILLSIFYN